MPAEHALRANNMTGQQLLKLGYQAANSYANTHPSFPAGRIEDLAMFCVEVVLRRAPSYEPTKNRGFNQAKNPSSTPFKSWAWMQMQNACLDFVRRRNEGFQGRIGRDKPITVTTGITDDIAEHDSVDQAIDDLTIRRTETDRWRIAAQRQGKTLEQFVRDALEHAAA